MFKKIKICLNNKNSKRCKSNNLMYIRKISENVYNLMTFTVPRANIQSYKI